MFTFILLTDINNFLVKLNLDMKANIKANRTDKITLVIPSKHMYGENWIWNKTNRTDRITLVIPSTHMYGENWIWNNTNRTDRITLVIPSKHMYGENWIWNKTTRLIGSRLLFHPNKCTEKTGSEIRQQDWWDHACYSIQTNVWRKLDLK